MMEDKIESKPIDKWWTLAVIGVIMLGVFVCINVYDEYKADANADSNADSNANADSDWVDAINSGKSVDIYTDDGRCAEINRYGNNYHNAKISGGYLTMDKTSGSSHLCILMEHITKVSY